MPKAALDDGVLNVGNQVFVDPRMRRKPWPFDDSGCFTTLLANRRRSLFKYGAVHYYGRTNVTNLSKISLYFSLRIMVGPNLISFEYANDRVKRTQQDS